jgi:hypothetical protein
MAELLIGPDGSPVDVDAAEEAFNAAMAAPAPGEQPDYPAPPRRDYGTKADGTPKRAAGRPRKDPADKARTVRALPPPPVKDKAKGGGSRPVTDDYSEALNNFGAAVWMGLAAIPVPHTQALGAVWKHQLPAQVQAWNLAAQQDPGVRHAVEKLSSGPTWLIGIAVATAPLVGAAVAIVRDPQVRADLAQQTQAEFAEFLKSATPENAEKEPAAA